MQKLYRDPHIPADKMERMGLSIQRPAPNFPPLLHFPVKNIIPFPAEAALEFRNSLASLPRSR